MPMPSMPGSGFIMVEAKLVLGCLETVLDSPAVALNADEGFYGGSGWAPRREEGQIAIDDVAPDQ